MAKKYKRPICAICGEPYERQLHRGWLLKKLSFIFPVRRFFCVTCGKSTYKVIKKKR